MTINNAIAGESKKSTELGLLPENWYVSKIKEISQIKTGGKNTQDKKENGIYPFFVRSQNIERIDSYSYDGEAILTAGDGVGVGKVFHYINGKFDCHQRVYRLSHFENEIDGFFLFKYFQNNFYQRIMQMTAKSSVDSVRMDMISEMAIPIPPKNEQKAIAKILYDTDCWIESLEALIDKKRRVKNGVMQRLLTPKKHWKTITFDEAFRFLSTASYSRAQLSMDESIGYVHYGDIHTKWTFHLDLPKSVFPTISLDKVKSCQFLKNGDLVMADASEDYNGIGKSVEVKNLTKEKIIAGLHTFLLRDEVGYFAPGFKGFIPHSSFVKRQFDALATGLKVFSLSKSSLKIVEIPLPPINEQVNIAEILSEMEEEIDALENQLFKARRVSQGMTGQLLKGKIRVGINSLTINNE
ncbi:restriction endonuclease subunit S [Mucilaginibacter sp. UYCu711]|uniref:restriction endonuclease subunit S n=1 Tax=Mucilaginibacter sp. UYCu711 TaxID=3156339 RepID=UPI003D1EB50B